MVLFDNVALDLRDHWLDELEGFLGAILLEDLSKVRLALLDCVLCSQSPSPKVLCIIAANKEARLRRAVQKLPAPDRGEPFFLDPRATQIPCL